jgi:hypothetical protein
VKDGQAPSLKATRIADWIERAALRHGTGALSQPTLRALGGEAGYGEADIALGLATASRRAALLGDAYPFRVGMGVAARPDAADCPWTALLMMSSDSPVRPLLDIAATAANLERITASALQGLYGPRTEAVRFAWPSDDGRPQEFRAAIRWLASRMGVEAGDAYRPPYAKDGGVDVVVWLPFPDRRSGFPVMLIQCTLERDYVHKARDVDLPIWSGYLRLDVAPATALAIPEVVPGGEEWNALAARTVVLDRTRLAALAGGGPEGRLSADLTTWTAQALENLRGLS